MNNNDLIKTILENIVASKQANNEKILKDEIRSEINNLINANWELVTIAQNKPQPKIIACGLTQYGLDRRIRYAWYERNEQRNRHLEWLREDKENVMEYIKNRRSDKYIWLKEVL